MLLIHNPILRGFNPDPSIICVGDDYYIATSTFEWFPGVQIHHSRDLANWRLLARPLARRSQLDMRGVRASGGIWAPCLSYDGRLFHLVYTNVKTDQQPFMDAHNYLVTASDIKGEWSEPVYLHSMGFDPSMFHDIDDRKWLVGMESDFRPDKNRFAGIIMREYSPEEKRLVGPQYRIFEGTKLGFTEGPHIYRQGEYYYLIVAEGGTGYEHAVTVARSKTLTGPYEPDPAGPVLTSADEPQNPLQKAGHADIIQTKQGEWFMVHLCARPIARKGRCVLGRETAIQKVIWTEDGWLHLQHGGNEPQQHVQVEALNECRWPQAAVRDDFDSSVLGIDFQTLRVPLGEDSMSLDERKGYLRLKGRESLYSKFEQSLVARRQQAFSYTASACIEFQPYSYRQMAGLICLYDHENFFYLRLTHQEGKGRVIGVLAGINGKLEFPAHEIDIGNTRRIYLSVTVDVDRLRFEYSQDDVTWYPAGGVYDASRLSDEACREGGFTGAFVGMCCQDLTGNRLPADFDYFEYIEK